MKALRRFWLWLVPSDAPTLPDPEDAKFLLRRIDTLKAEKAALLTQRDNLILASAQIRPTSARDGVPPVVPSPIQMKIQQRFAEITQRYETEIFNLKHRLKVENGEIEERCARMAAANRELEATLQFKSRSYKKNLRGFAVQFEKLVRDIAHDIEEDGKS